MSIQAARAPLHQIAFRGSEVLRTVVLRKAERTPHLPAPRTGPQRSVRILNSPFDSVITGTTDPAVPTGCQAQGPSP